MGVFFLFLWFSLDQFSRHKQFLCRINSFTAVVSNLYKHIKMSLPSFLGEKKKEMEKEVKGPILIFKLSTEPLQYHCGLPGVHRPQAGTTDLQECSITLLFAMVSTFFNVTPQTETGHRDYFVGRYSPRMISLFLFLVVNFC